MKTAMDAARSPGLNDKGRTGIMLTSILLGLISAAGGAYAQEVVQKPNRQSAEPITGMPAGIGDYERLLNEADMLIKKGKPADAYALLEPFEFNHAGEPRFDYLIGIAALDSGIPDKATLAFERALAVNPDFTAARMDMARAYFQLGDMLRAKTEFTVVLKQHPSESARLTIQRYLDAIALHEGERLTRVSGYIEGSVGYDSNVNWATGQSQIFVDYYAANYPLDPASIKAADNYYAVAAGGLVTLHLDAKWSLYAGADLKQRNNQLEKDFDIFSLEGRTGMMLDAKNERMRIGLLGGSYNLGVSHYSDITGLDAEWSHAFSPVNQFKAFGRYARYRFVDPVMQVNDYDQRILGVGWQHVMMDGKSAMFASLYHGTESDVSDIITLATPDGGRADGAKRFNGLRVGGQIALSDGSDLFFNAGEQIGGYGRVNPLFLRLRSDRLYDLTAGANWRFDGHWTLRPQLVYSRNISDIAIYEYDRTDVSLTVRRDFR